MNMKRFKMLTCSKGPRRNFLFSLAGGLLGFTGANFLPRNPLSFLNLDTPSELMPFIHPFNLAFHAPTETSATIIRPPIGENAAVYFDEIRKTIKRVYGTGFLTVGGLPPVDNDSTSLFELYSREKQAYSVLHGIQSAYIARKTHFDDRSQTMTMPYLGPDLLIRSVQQGWKPTPSHLEQIVEMYAEYRQVGFFKLNTSRPNLYLDESNNKLVAADFKWFKPRNLYQLTHELHMLHRDTLVLSPDLPRMLQPTFDDFSTDIVEKSYQWLEKNPLKDRFDFQNGKLQAIALRQFLEEHFSIKILA